MGLKIPQLTIPLKLMAENFEYAIYSADRPKPTAVFDINRSRQKYSLATSVLARILKWSTSDHLQIPARVLLHLNFHKL